MSRVQKVMYTDIIDGKVSYEFYMSSFSGDNHENIQRQCKILESVVEKKLTKAQKQILYMYYDNKLTMQDIANTLGKDKSTISKSLKRSKEIIEDYMQFTSFRQ